jgi:hypothetical protein
MVERDLGHLDLDPAPRRRRDSGWLRDGERRKALAKTPPSGFA